MQPASLHGVNGLVRRRIATIGAAYGGRVISATRAISDDHYLGSLVRSGRISEEQLRNVLKGYNLFPDGFVWLGDFDDGVISRAEAVFRARYGRDPVKHADFKVNGGYHRICKDLTKNWGCYDEDLQTLSRDCGEDLVLSDAEQGFLSLSVVPIQVSTVTIWMILAVILLGLLAFYGANKTGNGVLIVISSIGLFVASVASVCVFPPYRCPRCRRKYAKPTPDVCNRCGVRFRSADRTAETLSEDRFSIALRNDSAALQ